MSQFYPLIVEDLYHETAAAVVITFTLSAELREIFRYRQGQHLTLRREFAGIEERRNYSICASVQDDCLRIAIKQVPDGLFSTWANNELRVGEQIDVMPPSGRFFAPLDADSQQPHSYLFIAAGSGITPILSLLKTTLETESLSRCTLLYGNRSSTDVLFVEELEDLKDYYRERLSLMYIFSREQQQLELLNGHIDAEKIKYINKLLLPLGKLQQCFICGPQALLETVKTALQRYQLTTDRIHFELFTTAQSRQPFQPRSKSADANKQVTAHSHITIVADGKTTEFSMPRSGEAILDAALRVRHDLPYACKGGMCCTCRAKVITGEVAMAVCYGLEQDEQEAGYVLSCQAIPLSDQVTLSFDQR